MAVKNSFEDIVKNYSKELSDILQKDYRKELNTRITIVDVSYNAMKAEILGSSISSIKGKYFYKLYTTFKEVLREKVPSNRKFSSFDEIPDNYFDSNNPPILIENYSNDTKYLVGRSFGSIRTFLTDKISKDSRLLKTRLGVINRKTEVLNASNKPTGSYTTQQVSRINIGHTSGEENEILTSPLEEKFLETIKFFQGDSTTTALIKNTLNKLYEIQSNIEYSFRNETPEAIQHYRSKLGSAYIVVTIHTDRQNANFAKLEQKLYFELRNIITKKYSMGNISGSNTIIEDIEQGIINTLKSGKSNLKKHSNNKGTIKNTLKKNFIVDKKSISLQLRDQQGHFTSLVSLQNLLNQKLATQVANNMGQKGALVYRTGRFANSARVEKLQMQRDGAIGIFYTYMKYPYQTFEPGFAQGSKARDPKDLITKSIRELATGLVTSRLRITRV